jgi:Flp pilus assembly protein TadG
MHNALHRLRRGERGMSLVFVGMGFMGFMAASTLAIDVGMFMTARSQAQNSADAGALAGAIALVFNDYDNRTATGPAVQSAINAALANVVMGNLVSVGAADVTFPLSPEGLNNRVRVTVRRNTERANPIPTLIGPLFGVPTVDIMAVATAEASPANAATCVMPFTIPDRWTERQTPTWDPDDDFNMFANNGSPLADPDIYIPPGQEGATGYDAERDKGLRIVLKNNNQNKTAPSFYNPWRLPGSTGADDYRDNIAGCNTNIVAMGDPMEAEPGNMVGPTRQGTEDLVAKDPYAYWNTDCNCVKGSAFGKSPRIAVIPLYDPVYYETGKHNGSNASLRVANYLGFFIEGLDGNEVVGRITPVTGLVRGNPGELPVGAFPKAIRLVE